MGYKNKKRAIKKALFKYSSHMNVMISTENFV